MQIILIILLGVILPVAILLGAYKMLQKKDLHIRQKDILLEERASAVSSAEAALAASSARYVSAEAEINRQRSEIESLRSALAASASKIESAAATESQLRTRLEYYERNKAEMEEENRIRFKNLATDILRQNSAVLKQQQEEHLGEIIRPLKENIEQFKKTFSESYEKESRERFALDKHIQQLVDLNRTISREAQDLTRALRGNSKVQGDWGEMILEGILERSGLRRDVEFSVQECTSDSDGRRLRADVVINYPDGRRAVIDSKVSLTDYVNYINEDDDSARKAFLAAHVRSVRSHIAELRDKKYQDHLGEQKADFVMMFIPNEGAYLAAMNADHRLWEEAYDSRVIMISPTHLISVIKLVEQLWMHDRQTRHAIDIATAAGAMYDKFVGFLDDMTKIDKNLSAARDSYEAAIKKLSSGNGNLIGRASKLKEMGVKASKIMPQKFVPDPESDILENK